jgi:hypothetical protein
VQGNFCQEVPGSCSRLVEFVGFKEKSGAENLPGLLGIPAV